MQIRRFHRCYSTLILGLALASTAQASPNQNQLVLKSGESVSLQNLFWVARCHSLLKGPMVAEALEAPPGITVSVKPQDIIPHNMGCARAVPGGVLTVTAAPNLAKRVEGHLTIRVKYPTVDGERQRGFAFDAIVVP